MILFSAGLFAALAACITNWMSLIPWRWAKNQHWTERARRYHPVRLAAASNLWVLPAVVTMFCMLVWPEEGPHWAFLVLVTAIGSVAGTLPMDREVFPRIAWPDLLRQATILCLRRFSVWFVLLAVASVMPSQFNLQVLYISTALLLVFVLWNRLRWGILGRKLGWLLPPPDRLQKIVQETATRMAVPFKEVWLVRSSLAQAAALPARRVLLFTERLLELLSDQEIATICAHELAHLSESRQQYWRRYVIWLSVLPWVLVKPLLDTCGPLAFVGLVINTVAWPVLYRRISRKLEVRADTMAYAQEPDPGIYAQALLRLHEDSLVPAVLAKDRATHPHLYDRLLAAGVTPDFPRPAAAASTAWSTWLLSFALGILAMMLISRLTGTQ